MLFAAYLPPTHKPSSHFPAHYSIVSLLILPAGLPPDNTSYLPAPYSLTYCSFPCLLSYWLMAYFPAGLPTANTSCLPAPYSPTYCSLTCSLSYCRIAYCTCSSFSCVHLLLTCPLLIKLLLTFLFTNLFFNFLLPSCSFAYSTCKLIDNTFFSCRWFSTDPKLSKTLGKQKLFLRPFIIK